MCVHCVSVCTFIICHLQFIGEHSIKQKIKGVYVHGNVGEFILCNTTTLQYILCCGIGSGKTMLMDLFYDTVELAKKKRVHFNSFMLDVHNS